MKHLKSVMWPTEIQIKILSSVYLRCTGFRGVIGCIDRCHILFKGGVQDRSRFINRKGFSSIVLQWICNRNVFYYCIYRMVWIRAWFESFSLQPNPSGAGEDGFQWTYIRRLFTPAPHLVTWLREVCTWKKKRGITLYTIRLDRESIPSLKRNVQATEIIEHEPKHEYSRCDYDVYTCTTLYWIKSWNANIPLVKDVEFNFSTAANEREREREQQTGRKVIHRHIIQEFQKLKSFSSIDIIYKENICCTCLNENVPVHNQQLSVDLFIKRSMSHFPHLNNTSLWGYSMSFFKTFSIYIFFYILNPFKPSRNACLEKSTYVLGAN